MQEPQLFNCPPSSASKDKKIAILIRDSKLVIRCASAFQAPGPFATVRFTYRLAGPLTRERFIAVELVDVGYLPPARQKYLNSYSGL
jgi:hypothetical protein